MWNWGTKDGKPFKVPSLLEYLRKIPDYRCGRAAFHDVAEMLACLIAGYANGRTSVGRALEWCRNHIGLLRKHMPLKHGIASEATISRMLSGIDEEMFSLVIMEWIAGIVKERGIHIAIDGKALRGATEKIKGRHTPYVLNAIDVATELVLAQLAIDEKTNEITSIPKLLEYLEVQDNVFTIDAIGTQKQIEKLIVEKGGHFVLQVKKNNPALYEEIITEFAAFEKEKELDPAEWSKKMRPFLEKYETWSSQEKNRERIECREVKVCREGSFLDCVKEGELPFIKSVGCVTQVRIPCEKDKEGNDITVSKKEFLERGSVRKPHPLKGDGIGDDIQQIGMISDLELHAWEMADYKRAHWKIENNLHHVLDDVFREDRSSAKKSRNNLAQIRKIAYNLLRLALIKEYPGSGVQWMMDHFCDYTEMIEKYMFQEIESFY